jgi:hypothetical protein
MKLVFRFSVLALLLCVASSLLFAQAGTGTIQGTVKDPSGAVVSSAAITATNTATGLKRTATSNASGGYTITSLPPGSYTIDVTASGFAPTKQTTVLTVGANNTVDVTMGVAAASTTVEVVGEGAAEVNTINQQVSSVVTSQQIANLPTLTRNPYDLVATAGNVSQDTQAGMGDARGAGFAINGQRSASTDILLDGAENVDEFTAQVGQTVPLDSVREFRVITNGMSAEYGRASGGVINVATKSGTNSFHGSAYEYNRISALAANTYDNAANGVPKPHFTRNQFGFSLGGPIIKNKLFFFDNAEWIRVRSNAAQITQVPDAAFIATASPATQAFFAAYGKLRSDLVPIGTVTAGDITNPGSSSFVSGTGPLFNALPAATPVLDLVRYNAPSDAGAGLPENTVMNVGRIDFNLSSKTQLFGRYSVYKENDFAGVINTSPYAGFETPQNVLDQNFMLSVTHTFTTNLLSNTRLVYSRLNLLQPLGTAPVGPTLYLSNSRTGRIGGHLVAFPGYNEYTPGNAIPFGGPQNLGQIFEDMSWVHGNHTFRFGGQFIHTQDNRAFGAYEEAVQALATGGNTGTALDNFLSGNLATFQAAVNPQGKFPCNTSAGVPIVTPGCTVTLPVGAPSFSRSNLYNDSALYAQDTWKVLPRLTLDLGLRWEYYGVQHNRNQALDSNFYFGPGMSTGNTIFDQIRSGFVSLSQSSPVGGLWKPSSHNFGPRIGFAYDVFGNGKTALRGGYGISYERDFGNVTYNVIQNPPNYAVIAITPAVVGGPIPVSVSNAGPLAGNVGSVPLPRSSLRAVDPNIKTAYAEQWNLNVEQQLNNNLVVSLGYNGSRGIHQYAISNINDPGYGAIYLGDTSNTFLNTQYSAINLRSSLGDSWYNGLTAALRGRVTSFATVTANYTWSHSIDTLSSAFSDEVQNNGLGYLDPFNAALDKGSSDYDARHRVSISMILDSPWFKNSSSTWKREALGGFQMIPLFTFHSGYPYTVFDCTNSGAFYNCPRADVTGAYSTTGNTSGGDIGGNIFNYLAVPAAVGQYTGPTVIPGTSTPLPDSILGFSNLPTCTGLDGVGCTFPSNMLRRNAFRGPSVWNWDLGVYKNFKITERVNLQLRGEFYDLLNHKNFYVLGFGVGGADVSSLPTNSAGLPIIQAKKGGFGNPFDEHRNTQLAIRVTF